MKENSHSSSNEETVPLRSYQEELPCGINSAAGVQAVA